jgi:hypothetical protein
MVTLGGFFPKKVNDSKIPDINPACQQGETMALNGYRSGNPAIQCIQNLCSGVIAMKITKDSDPQKEAHPNRNAKSRNEMSEKFLHRFPEKSPFIGLQFCMRNVRGQSAARRRS